MNNIPNRQIMNDVLIKAASEDKDIVVLTSDSRGSSKLSEFADKLPQNLIEVGIAEQNIVGIAAGLAHSGKKPFISSYAPFLTTRSIEQIKVDVAYSDTNVKVIGVSGGVSYGQLGMTHHSLQDFAMTRSIPNLQVLCPADRFETECMMKELIKSDKPAYVRLGRNAVEDVYKNTNYNFKIGKAVILTEGDDVTLIATGQTVKIALDASKKLEEVGINATVLNIHTIKPLDTETIKSYAQKTKKVISLEEHSVYGGLGSSVAEALSEYENISIKIIGFPDEALVCGSRNELFEHYGLSVENIVNVTKEFLG